MPTRHGFVPDLGTLLFAVLPYVALFTFLLVTIQRYRSKAFTYSSLSSQFLENRQHFWALVPFHYGIIILLFGHFVGLLIPRAVLLWNSHPLRLYVLEVTALAFGVQTLVGLLSLVFRRFQAHKVRVTTSAADWLVYVLLLIQVVAGIAVAVLYPWGTSWYAAAAPYLQSLFLLRPDTSYVSAMHGELTLEDRRRGWWILAMNTLAFTVCFMAWMLNGVLITYLVDNGVHRWDAAEMGWLIGIPVLSGSIFRLPAGLATDKWGGRIVFTVLLLISAAAMYVVAWCNRYWEFFFAGLEFGLCGTAFAVGIAYTSVWFPQARQGLALGIFGAGNAGAALTSFGAPWILRWLTDSGENLDAWRSLPKLYAGSLLATGVLFALTTANGLPVGSAQKTMLQRLEPLKYVRVWRFGLYYFFVFGGFVGLAQWLVPYYVNAYGTTVALAGALAACNSLPSGVIRALGGWISDHWGVRTVMYWVFGLSLICCLALSVPQMDIHAPGSGITARFGGTVEKVTDTEIVVRAPKVGVTSYPLHHKPGELVTTEERNSGLLVWPRSLAWQEAVVKPGDMVAKKQLLARGVTQIFFQANIWIFTILSLLLGAVMGVGKAAVYKHIPDYFPYDVGVVGGIVGVLGGLGGFVCPVIFGYLLKATGLWTSCWMFFFVLVAVCLVWMHLVIRRMLQQKAPHLMHPMETLHPARGGTAHGEPQPAEGIATLVPVPVPVLAEPMKLAEAPNALTFAFLGALVGSLVRPLGGWFSDRFGGVRVTQWDTLVMIGAALGVAFCVRKARFSPEPGTWFLPFLLLFLLLFVTTGIGNGSTFRMIPIIFPKEQAGPVLGWTSAIAAYGAFLIPTVLSTQIKAGTPEYAMYGFVVYYVSCLLVNWWYYARRGAEIVC